MVGGISTAGLIGTKAIIKVDGFGKEKNQSTQGKDSKSYIYPVYWVYCFRK
jgi:hypothetical protein